MLEGARLFFVRGSHEFIWTTDFNMPVFPVMVIESVLEKVREPQLKRVGRMYYFLLDSEGSVNF